VGFTLLELMVVMVTVAIIASILFPIFARAREKARQTCCMSKLAQLHVALHMYAQDYDGHFPPAGVGAKACLYEYVKDDDVFFCPSSSYSGRRAGDTRPLGNEDDWGAYQYYPGRANDGEANAPLLSDREFLHNRRANVSLVAGGVRSLSESEWADRGWESLGKPAPPPEDKYGDSGGMGGGS